MVNKYKLTEAEILAKTEAKVKNCVGWFDSKISQEREKVAKYYEAKLPLRQNEGKSSYISSDVYDAVEMMKAQLLEVFGGGPSIARFKPRGMEDVRQAIVETKYVSHVIFEQNPGFQIIHDAIHDGLTARNGVAKVYWEEHYTHDEQKFEHMSLDEVYALAAQDEISDIEADFDEGSDAAPTYTGSYRRRFDHCQLRIVNVAPEEFFIEARVKRREDGMRGHKTKKTRAELIAEGYDKAKIAKIQWDEGYSLDLSPESQARQEATGEGAFGNDPQQEELKAVLLHEAYDELCLNGDGRAALYKIILAGGQLLDIEEVDEDPFVDWAPLRRPHTWWGNNYAARTIQTQNARTVLTRAILDHTAITTNPRWQVVQGGLLNPREMLDNRLGGLVNTTRPDAVLPLPVSSLNPFVFETLGMLKDNKEENTGISSLSQGLNKDAISSQNAEGLVDKMVALSQIRQKIIARNFANDFLIPLYLKVWQNVMKYEKKQHVIELAGEYETVDPQAWADKRDVTVVLELGYGELDRRLQKKMQLWQVLSQDPAAREFAGPEQRHKLLVDLSVDGGIENYAEYIGPPGTNQPPGPDPIEIMKAEAAKQTAEAALINAQAALLKAQSGAQAQGMAVQQDQIKTALNAHKDNRDATRKDLDTVNRIDVSQREISLAEKVPAENQRGVFSPSTAQ